MYLKREIICKEEKRRERGKPRKIVGYNRDQVWGKKQRVAIFPKEKERHDIHNIHMQ